MAVQQQEESFAEEMVQLKEVATRLLLAFQGSSEDQKLLEASGVEEERQKALEEQLKSRASHDFEELRREEGLQEEVLELWRHIRRPVALETLQQELQKTQEQLRESRREICRSR